MSIPQFTTDAAKEDFEYLRQRSGMSLNCLDRLFALGRACADAQREAASLRERGDVEIAVAQAVEFAEYVSDHAKGKMVERAKHFLSLPYSQEIAAKLRRGELLAANA